MSKGLLNLKEHIPQRDVRKLIFSYLNEVDRSMVRAAHNSKYRPWGYMGFVFQCCKYGNVALLDWLYFVKHRSRKKQWDWYYYLSDILKSAIDGGHTSVLEWLHQYEWKFKISVKMFNIMIAAGRLDLLKWFYEKEYRMPISYWREIIDMFYTTCEHNRPEIFQWLLDNNNGYKTILYLPVVNESILFCIAMKNPGRLVFNWLVRYFPSFKVDISVFESAITYSNIEMLDYFYNECQFRPATSLDLLNRCVPVSNDTKIVIQWLLCKNLVTRKHFETYLQRIAHIDIKEIEQIINILVKYV